MENLKELLKQGQTVIFDNDRFCTENESDNFRVAECGFRNETKNTWANGFKIQFNGALLTFKTFKSFENRLNELKRCWSLELNETETEICNQ